MGTRISAGPAPTPTMWGVTTRVGSGATNLASVAVQGQLAGVALALAIGLTGYLVLRPHIELEAKGSVGR
jgi:hypothetical protein